MIYPTLNDVDKASHELLCRWWRFLRSPESDGEIVIIRRIAERFTECGGFTPEISKRIGWDGS